MPEGSTLGLALSGGAVLGCAHIGVLKALDELGIRVTHLAGSSMGGLVASFYACGLTGAEIEKIAEDLRWPRVTGLAPSKLGFLSQEKLKKTLRSHLGNVRLENTRIPLALIATDISSGEKVILTDGDLAVAASATSSFPGIFLPVEWEGRLLVDGGLVENLPLSPLKAWGVDRIIAVDVFLGMTFHRPTTFIELIKNSVDIVLVQAARKEAETADLLIAPDLDTFSSTELDHIPALVKEGYRAAMKALEGWEIRESSMPSSRSDRGSGPRGT